MKSHLSNKLNCYTVKIAIYVYVYIYVYKEQIFKKLA